MAQLQQTGSNGQAVAQPKTSECTDKDRVRVKNRRRVYLERHPSYFTQSELELAEPLLYDRCIRIFQSPAEREETGRAKGFSGALEAALHRSEARLAALADQPSSSTGQTHPPASQDVEYVNGGLNDQDFPDDHDGDPRTREEGLVRWREEMTSRFLTGNDSDFPYTEVDDNDDLDTMEERDAEDHWFDAESPEWDKNGSQGTGETGIQDF
ncbi:MAG: hypothetical protein M1818_003213 [Claussenomyces sp. TS43310]|nr:MAG: hypothetical protein M1818_003213 [Claussenomyces sp. TS43310]